jgi:hypothetical protein
MLGGDCGKDLVGVPGDVSRFLAFQISQMPALQPLSCNSRSKAPLPEDCCSYAILAVLCFCILFAAGKLRIPSNQCT